MTLCTRNAKEVGMSPIERMETDESNKVIVIFLYNVINTNYSNSPQSVKVNYLSIHTVSSHHSRLQQVIL